MPPVPRSERRQRGFTLIEATMVIALTGTLVAVVGRFILPPVQGYLAVATRTTLVDNADGALRRIGRELRASLPNSARVTADGLSLELIPTTGGARYATAGSGALQFGVLDTGFDLVGPGLALSPGQSVVFYNLGPAVAGSNAYAPVSSAAEQLVANRRTVSNAAGTATTVALNSLAALPAANLAAPYRVTAVADPVTYRCDLSAGTLTRYSGYGFVAVQPNPPTGGSSALLATGVSACRFSADGTVVASRAGLVQLQLSLTATTPMGNETVALHHAVHVDNLP